MNWDAAAVEEDGDEGKVHVKAAVAFRFEHGAYAVLAEDTVEGVAVVGRREFDKKADGGGLLLNNSRDGVGVLEDGGAD